MGITSYSYQVVLGVLLRSFLQKMLNQLQLLNKKMEHKEFNGVSDSEPEEKIHFKPLRQKFTYMGHQINHESVLQVEPSKRNSEKLEIKNRYGFIAGDKVTKVTEIQLEDRIIKIIDSFSYLDYTPIVNSICEQNGLHQNPIKNCTVKDLGTSQCNPDKSKRPKNVVKNIFRHFQTWLQKESSPELGFRTALKFLIHSHRQYNHGLLVRLSESPELRRAFISFCQQHGEEAIVRSKIENKRYHLETLRQYHRLCCNKHLSEQMSRHLSNSSQEEEDSFSSIELEQAIINDSQGGQSEEE